MKVWAHVRAFGLPSLLLAIVAVTHVAPDLIGSLYTTDSQVRAATAWHSVLRAFPESTLLYLIVWLLMPWEPKPARIAASLVCAWGAAESFMIAGCRLQFPMDRPPPKTELYTGLCDVATGWPVYMLTIAVVLLVSILRKAHRGPP
jgi:hypothetical protein